MVPTGPEKGHVHIGGYRFFGTFLWLSTLVFYIGKYLLTAMLFLLMANHPSFSSSVINLKKQPIPASSNPVSSILQYQAGYRRGAETILDLFTVIVGLEVVIFVKLRTTFREV